MAGIGFELRKILKKDSLLSLLKMYSYSAVLSSGAWVISILAILVVGIISIVTYGQGTKVFQMQIIITYAFALASSLILAGFLQLPLTRYIADLIFAKREDEVLGTYMGVLFVVLGVGAGIFIPASWILLPSLSFIQHILVVAIFLALSAVWISNILVTSLKYYRSVVAAYLLAYGFIVLFSYLAGRNFTTLLFIFFAGNAVLLTVMMILIYKSYRSKTLMRFEFFKDKDFYFSLGIAGLFYNLGIWIDKFIFWYHPLTGNAVIGYIHASVLYDLPIFLSYLTIIPGMAIFFYRLEADFAEKYELFYNSVREAGTLAVIEMYRKQMIDVIRLALKEVILVQAVIDVVFFLVAPYIFKMLHIPQLYLGLFYILTVGATLQLGFMVVLALLFYLDRRIKAMWLSILFVVLNAVLTWVSIYMGPSFFGYGYTISLLIVFIISLIVIRNTMERLVYETFMHQ